MVLCHAARPVVPERPAANEPATPGVEPTVEVIVVLPRSRRPAGALRALAARPLRIRATGCAARGQRQPREPRRRSSPAGLARDAAGDARRGSASVQLLGAEQRGGGALRRRSARLPEQRHRDRRARTGSSSCCRGAPARTSAPSRRSCSTPTGACSTPASRSACTAGRATRSPVSRLMTRRRSARPSIGPRNWLAVTRGLHDGRAAHVRARWAASTSAFRSAVGTSTCACG